MKETTKIQGITFDAGGTLLYPYPSVGAIYSEVMKDHGLVLHENVLDQAFRQAWKQAHSTTRINLSEESEKDWWRSLVYQTLKGLAEPSNFDILFDQLWFTFAEPRRWQLHPGAILTLQTLKKRGYHLAILSNWDQRLRSLLEGLEISPFFEHLIISSEVGFEKPCSNIFRVVENRMNLAANQLLHVGDSFYHDIEGAQKAGWNSILIAHHPDPTKTHPDQISHLEELLKILP